jgi:hypothetical protein
VQCVKFRGHVVFSFLFVGPLYKCVPTAGMNLQVLLDLTRSKKKKFKRDKGSIFLLLLKKSQGVLSSEWANCFAVIYFELTVLKVACNCRAMINLMSQLFIGDFE